MSIELEHLTKRYQGTPVVDNVSLHVGSGEFFVLLGPSGSGKSTLLRMIAGLADVEEGTVRLHGRDVTNESPKDRGIGFVFQHYGLFRHMTVADNVEFALSVRKVPARRRRERREELLQLVGLSGFAGRYPAQLSGGQQQRVALARSLAHEPEVLLLDEPFGALDTKIRVELRQALRAIQRELALTTVFVTHDQEEAFDLADRLAVLREGRLLEVGEPQELYLRPRSPFVATFLGAANVLVGESSAHAVRLGPVELAIATELASGRTPRRAQVLVRPEDVELSRHALGDQPRLGRGIVERRAAIAGFERVRLRLPRLPGVRPVAPAPPFGADHLLVDATRPQHEAMRHPLGEGDETWVAVRRFHVLAPASLRILIDSGSTPPARAAGELGRLLATRVDAHTTLLSDGSAAPHDDQSIAEQRELGAETERPDDAFDMAVLGLDAERIGDRIDWLVRIRHHLLLVPEATAPPCRFLVCVTVGEPGKAHVRFAERLAWQLGASATVLTVLDGSDENDAPRSPHVDRFLAACTRALSARGVVARSCVRRGPVVDEILAELNEGGHDMLVVGTPVDGGEDRHTQRLGGVVERLIREVRRPLLIVKR